MREEDVFEMQSAESKRVDMLDTRGKSKNDQFIATCTKWPHVIKEKI